MKEELIGKQAEVLWNGKSFSGTIIDETKNIIHLKTNQGLKKLIKKDSIFRIDGKEILGKDITKRPEERIKW